MGFHWNGFEERDLIAAVALHGRTWDLVATEMASKRGPSRQASAYAARYGLIRQHQRRRAREAFSARLAAEQESSESEGEEADEESLLARIAASLPAQASRSSPSPSVLSSHLSVGPEDGSEEEVEVVGDDDPRDLVKRDSRDESELKGDGEELDVDGEGLHLAGGPKGGSVTGKKQGDRLEGVVHQDVDGPVEDDSEEELDDGEKELGAGEPTPAIETRSPSHSVSVAEKPLRRRRSVRSLRLALLISRRCGRVSVDDESSKRKYKFLLRKLEVLESIAAAVLDLGRTDSDSDSDSDSEEEEERARRKRRRMERKEKAEVREEEQEEQEE